MKLQKNIIPSLTGFILLGLIAYNVFLSYRANAQKQLSAANPQEKSAILKTLCESIAKRRAEEWTTTTANTEMYFQQILPNLTEDDLMIKSQRQHTSIDKRKNKKTNQ